MIDVICTFCRVKFVAVVIFNGKLYSLRWDVDTTADKMPESELESESVYIGKN